MIKISDELIKNKDEKAFPMSENLFCEVQKYVSENNIAEGTCFPVLDEEGRVIFQLIYLEDLIAGIKRKDLTDCYDRFRNDKENLDFSFLNQFQKFVFLQVDGYSVALAELIARCCPDKRIFFCDKRAKYFLRGRRARYLPFLRGAGSYMELTEEWMRGIAGSFLNRIKAYIGWKILGKLQNKGTWCIIKADRRNHPGKEGMVYNSQNVVYSLLWKKQHKNFGKENADKQIIVLDYPCDKEGLGTIVKCAFAHIMWMTKEGYVPVMDLHHYPNQYLNDSGENMWEYFFEPVSSVTVEEAYKSKNVIVATENDISWSDFHISPYQRKYMGSFTNAVDFRKIVRINSETMEYIENKIPGEFWKGSRILGVVMRGTAFRKEVAEKWHKEWRKDVVDADVFLQACNDYKDKLGCEYLFLATEDAAYFEMARNFFGDRLLCVEQKRTNYDYANQEYIPLNQALGLKDGKQAGRDYLAIIKGLTECKGLLYNVECGAVRLAWQLKQDQYELFQCISGK